MSKNLPSINWTPDNEVEANKSLQIFGEYANNHKSVVELAVEHLETSNYIKKRLKWAALALRAERGDDEVVQQMADSALIGHIRKLDKVVQDMEESMAKGKEAAEAAMVEAKKQGKVARYKPPSIREYVGLLRERRLALMDLARLRGVLDFSRNGQSGGINIILPSGLNRGQGADNIVYECKNEEDSKCLT